MLKINYRALARMIFVLAAVLPAWDRPASAGEPDNFDILLSNLDRKESRLREMTAKLLYQKLLDGSLTEGQKERFLGKITGLTIKTRRYFPESYTGPRIQIDFAGGPENFIAFAEMNGSPFQARTQGSISLDNKTHLEPCDDKITPAMAAKWSKIFDLGGMPLFMGTNNRRIWGKVPVGRHVFSLTGAVGVVNTRTNKTIYKRAVHQTVAFEVVKVLPKDYLPGLKGPELDKRVAKALQLKTHETSWPEMDKSVGFEVTADSPVGLAFKILAHKADDKTFVELGTWTKMPHGPTNRWQAFSLVDDKNKLTEDGRRLNLRPGRQSLMVRLQGDPNTALEDFDLLNYWDGILERRIEVVMPEQAK